MASIMVGTHDALVTAQLEPTTRQPHQGPILNSSALEKSEPDAPILTPKQDLNTTPDTRFQDHDSEDSDQEEETSLPMSSAAIRRRTDKNAFDSWINERPNTRSTTQDRVSSLNELPEYALSTASLFARQDAAGAIHDPREYQTELFEIAKQRNTIAVLDTGSGKTLIAILLLKYTLEQELINRQDQDYSPRVSFFLVDSVSLVFQQYAAIKQQVPQPVSWFCGAQGTDNWNKELWDEKFQRSMIMVCTAEVLAQCLMHSYITIPQINLLIFDEAHHAKKNHPYAKIVKHYYHGQWDEKKRPRIFGMTASPIDANTDVVKAAETLEELLDSQIATSMGLSLHTFVHKPTEYVWQYEKLPIPFETLLYNRLHIYSDVKILSKLFRYAKDASSTLGAWCSDRSWAYGLDEMAAERKAQRLETAESGNTRSRYGKALRPVSEVDAEKNKILDAAALVAEQGEIIPRPSTECLSSKVLLLHEKLQEYFERETDTKCIVFVEQRLTAIILNDLFQRIGTRHLRADILVGIRSSDYNSMGLSLRKQIITLDKFKKGTLNCLFSTSVGEEGLDIADCNLIIRFDLCSTMIQYIQSRGRARHKNSVFAHMVEKHNELHGERVESIKDSESIMRDFCKALPEDRLLQKSPFGIKIEDIMAKELGHKTLLISDTQAKLTFNDSQVVLDHYVASLQYESKVYAPPIYDMVIENNMFRYRVTLPETSPYRGTAGQSYPKKMTAKQSAAFETCVVLRRMGLLDEHLRSTYRKRLPAMRNAHLAINSAKKDNYAMLVKPHFWQRTRGTIPDVLYLTILELKPAIPLRADHAPLALLTREPLPQLPAFPLFLEGDIQTNVVSSMMDQPLPVTRKELEMLTSLTLCVFDDIFHKQYASDEKKMSYWLAPINSLPLRAILASQSLEAIDWQSVADIHKIESLRKADHTQFEWKLNPSPQAWLNKFLVDRGSGKYRYFSESVLPGVKPGDRPPQDAPFRRRQMDTILGYTLSTYGKGRDSFLSGCDWQQPVLRAEMVHLRRNLLDKMTQQEEDAKTKDYLICPEPLQVSALPPEMVRTCLTFPAIISRVESYLIATEACSKFNLAIPPDLALEAFTKDSDNTNEHREEQLHLQRGMGKNYERLEFLGDCFLKMATSISLFVKNPNDDEFDFHVNRMLLICNAHLFETATERLDLPPYIRSRAFNRRAWYPEGLALLQGKATDASEGRHALAKKSIADVCEALIGAAYLTCDKGQSFDMAVRAVSLFVDHGNHEMDRWSEYYQLYKLPAYQTDKANGMELDLAMRVEKKLGYRFEYPRLLRSAMTHPSRAITIPSYQRLEFLGDSLFDMVCINYIYRKYPERDPQWLTEHKMAMVSNKFLGAIAVELDFHKYLAENGALMGPIKEYAKEVRDVIFGELGEQPIRATDLSNANVDSWTHTEELHTRELPPYKMDFWTLLKDPPKCLPDTVEAYIGAIFVDSGFDYAVVEQFFEMHILKYFHDMTIYDTFANKHPTTFLHNQLTNDFGCQDYHIWAKEVPCNDGEVPVVAAAVVIHGGIMESGEASSGRYAKLKASQRALKLIESIPIPEFRKRYKCDCAVRDREAVNGPHGTAI